MSDEKSPQGWWTTLPGLLTASATAITAVGGLIAILGQQGLFHKPAPATPPVVASVAAAPDVASAPEIVPPVRDVAAAKVAHPQTESAPPLASAVPASVSSTHGEIGSNMTYFAGNWQNIHPATAGILKIQIRIADSTMFVHAWGKCRPTNCDFGEVQAQGIGSSMDSQPGAGVREVTAQFKNNVRQLALTIHPAPNDHIRVEALTSFIDQSGRAPLAKLLVFQRM